MLAITPFVFEASQEQILKSIKDRFENILAAHLTATMNNSTASGIMKVRKKRYTLHDDIILVVYKCWKAKRAKWYMLPRQVFSFSYCRKDKSCALGDLSTSSNQSDGDFSAENSISKKKKCTLQVSTDVNKSYNSWHNALNPKLKHLIIEKEIFRPKWGK